MIYYFLPIILIIGIFTSYQDIKYNKIKNKWIVYSIVVSIVLNMLLFFKDFNLDYYKTFLINLILTIIICIVLWLLGYWPAGDAKLIIAYTFLLPLTVYSINHFYSFPNIFLFINIFVPYALFIFMHSVMFKNKEIFKRLNYKEIIKSILLVFIVMGIVDYILITFSFFNNFLSRIILILLFYYVLDFFFKRAYNNSILVYIFLSLLRLFFQYNLIFNFDFFKIFVLYYVLFMFIRFFLIEVALSEKNKYVAFAPFAFVGVLLTIISGGMFINLIFILMGWL